VAIYFKIDIWKDAGRKFILLLDTASSCPYEKENKI
jgi:hypothetical protein